MKSNSITFLFLLLFTVPFSCKKQQTNLILKNTDAYKEYISAFSTGYHKRNQTVRVEFAKPAVDASQINQEVNPSLYKITPALPGKCVWKNVYLFEFSPDKKALMSNARYEMVLDLKTVFPQIEESLRRPVIEFFYQPLELSVNWSFPRPSTDGKESMYLSGTVYVNDEIEPGKLLESITIKTSDGKKLTPQIQVSATNPSAYDILVSPIPRLKKSSELKLQWFERLEEENQKSDEKSFRIPAINEFVVQGVDESRITNHELSIYFSNILDVNQDVRGMIKFKEDSSALQLEKETDVIHVHFPDDWQKKSAILVVNHLIKSREGMNLGNDYEYEFQLIQNPPAVRFVNRGSILPYSKEIILPFEAINLHTVEVEIFKTFTNNVLYNMHLGFDNYYDSYNLVKLGRIIKQQVINLDELSPGSNARDWKRYGLNLSELIDAEPGANYQVRICFKPEDSDYPCSDGKPEIPDNFYDEESGDPKIKSFWRSYSYYDYSEEANNDASDPCSISYYTSDHFAKTSFFASNIAMIAKSSDHGGQSMVAVFDVMEGSPVKNAEVSFYDQQLQLLSKKETDGNGLVVCDLSSMPSYIQAKSGKHYSYLKINENKSLSQSEFDISGVKLQEGIKSSLYTERGVWRPGDTIYLNAVIYQIDKKIPDQFPVELTVTNPQRQVIYKTNTSDHVRGLYSFQIPTKESDITGLYTARLKVGLSVFEKNLLIETVKPNRFKVEWPDINTYSTDQLQQGVPLKAMWLHGAPANEANANVNFRYKVIAPEFKKYQAYTFVDPEFQKKEGEQEVFNEKLDDHGEAKVNLPNFKDLIKSGKIQATLISKISGDDGDISTDYYETVVSPFNEYVGLKLPDNPFGRLVAKDVDQEIQIVVLNKDGNPVANREVLVELFHVSYEWWYELRYSYRGDYQRRSITKKEMNKVVRTDQNGKAVITINLKEYDRYCIKATNKENNYSTGEYFYTGWNYNQNSTEFVNILSFKAEKDEYVVGDKAKVELPGAASGKYLISLLRGDRLVRNVSMDAKKDKSIFEFEITPDMAPNIYVDVSFVQGRTQKKNDLPLRLYGVIPVKVIDENKKIHPVISMNNLIRPDEKFSIEVSEEHSKEMVYQLFIVDEGLLNLTRFKTPNPYNDIMAKEALTMLTWDNFNEVIGNMDGAMEKIFSIGGDLNVDENQETKNKRFKPVVLKSGPVTLRKGEKMKHEFSISNYIGAVRVMVIANDYNAFGAADKSVMVKNELMSQLTVPRVFAYNDEVLIPVTVFATDPKVKNVQVKLEVKGQIKLMESAEKKITFDQIGDKTVFYKVKGSGGIGNAEILVTASSGSFNSRNSVSLYVDNPNSISHEVKEYWIESGKSVKEMIAPYGMEGTRTVRMEVSGFQGLSLDKMIDELIQYPHGCLEQTTSAAFPQIYLSALTELSIEKKSEVAFNIQSAINKLRRFQRPDGSFSYWPDGDSYSDWANSYAGQFLIEARNAGYRVPEDLLQNWYRSQRTFSNSYRADLQKNYSRPYLMQAFRLYTMSLYGKPEWSAMNQMYQSKNSDFMSNVLLAGAYALGGKQDIAVNLFAGSVPDQKYYREYDYSFGSNTRDEALIAQILIAMNKKNEASGLLNKLIKRTSRNYYYSTQEMATILVALGKLYGNAKDRKMSFTYQWNDTKLSYETQSPVYMSDLTAASKQLFEFKNQGSIPVSVSIIQYGKETSTANVAVSNGLKMNVSIVRVHEYSAYINSGDEMSAVISISNPGVAGRIDNIALTAVFPSGIEIDNRRIGGIDDKNSRITYQDFRDDRVLNYFGLNAGETISIEIPLTAAYAGQYIAPFIVCEAMYDPSIYAKYRSGTISIQTRK